MVRREFGVIKLCITKEDSCLYCDTGYRIRDQAAFRIDSTAALKLMIKLTINVMRQPLQ
jgi:hypothetical protein